MKGRDFQPLLSRVEMHQPKDIQDYGYLLKGVTLPINEVAQTLCKEGVLHPQ